MTQDTKKDNLSPVEARAAIIAGNAPDNLTVGGCLYLSGTQITALPDNLTLGGGLYLSGTQIDQLAKGPNCPKLVITGSQHNIGEAEEGWGIFAGCEEFDLEWWEDEGNVEMLGNKHEYSEDEIKEYLVYVRFLLAMQRQRIAATQTEESDD